MRREGGKRLTAHSLLGDRPALGLGLAEELDLPCLPLDLRDGDDIHDVLLRLACGGGGGSRGRSDKARRGGRRRKREGGAPPDRNVQ